MSRAERAVSKRSMILIAILAAGAIVIGRYALMRSPVPAASIGTPDGHDEAAKAASRAMTFTQPGVPAQ